MAHVSRSRILAAVIVGIAAVMAAASSWTDSLVVDEVPHIGAGYSYVARADMRLNPEHPPLVKDLAGLPLLFLGLSDKAFMTPHWTTAVNGQWNFGRTLIFNSGGNPDAIKNLARLPMLIVFFLGSAYLIWRWSQERYGDIGALIATVLFSFSPTILAHARLVTTDMAAAAGILLSTYFFSQFLQKPSRRTFAWSALTLGIALLCKFNTALLGPYFLCAAVLYGGRRHGLRNAAWAVLIGVTSFVAVVWPVYIVQTWNYPVQRQAADTRDILSHQGSGVLKTVALWASDKPVLRAAGHWTLGLAMVAQRAGGENTIYWLGRVVKAGGPWYFPIVYFLKEPLAWWILVAIALTTLAFRRRTHPSHTDEWLWLLWLAIYWAVSMRSTLNIGIRHLLPVYPFTIMLVAGRLAMLADWLHRHDRRRFVWFSAGIAALVGWYVFESAGIFPFYLTYFNQLAGGPSGGYRYVADSNLDWGQDLRRLGQWVTEHRIAKLSLDYFGWADPSYYLKGRWIWTTRTTYRNARDFLDRNASDGWIAVSATFLQEATYQAQTDKNGYRWLLDYTPVTVVGNSIFVWHITK